MFRHFKNLFLAFPAPCALPNLASVDFLCPEIEFLGNLSSAGGGKEKNVTLPPRPSSLHHPQSFLLLVRPAGFALLRFQFPPRGRDRAEKDFTGGRKKVDKEFSSSSCDREKILPFASSPKKVHSTKLLFRCGVRFSPFSRAFLTL